MSSQLRFLSHPTTTLLAVVFVFSVVRSSPISVSSTTYGTASYITPSDLVMRCRSYFEVVGFLRAYGKEDSYSGACDKIGADDRCNVIYGEFQKQQHFPLATKQTYNLMVNIEQSLGDISWGKVDTFYNEFVERCYCPTAEAVIPLMVSDTDLYLKQHGPAWLSYFQGSHRKVCPEPTIQLSQSNGHKRGRR